MSVHELTKKQIVRIPRQEIERQSDEDRSVEISMMRTLMLRYPDKAREMAAQYLKITLTKTAA